MTVFPFALYKHSPNHRLRTQLTRFLLWAQASPLKPVEKLDPQNFPEDILEDLAACALLISNPDEGPSQLEETEFLTLLSLAAFAFHQRQECQQRLSPIDKVQKLEVCLGYAYAILDAYYDRLDGYSPPRRQNFRDIFHLQLAPDLKAYLNTIEWLRNPKEQGRGNKNDET